MLPCAHGGHKNVGYSGTGVRVAVSHCVFAGNQPGSFARAVLITTGPPLQPATICSPASLSTP